MPLHSPRPALGAAAGMDALLPLPTCPCNLLPRSLSLRPRPLRRLPPSAATAGALLDLIPETRHEQLDLDLPLYDSASRPPVDLAVVGGGPAGLAVAHRAAAAGLSVCAIDPSPLLVWPNNYGVWVDEFDALGLLDCLDTTWPSAVVFLDDHTVKPLSRPYARVDRRRLKSRMALSCATHGVRFHQAKVVRAEHAADRSHLLCDDGAVVSAALVLDATGFARRLVRYDDASYNPGYQVAYGVLAEVESHPFDVDKMVFMDWRDAHLAGDPDLADRNRSVPTFLYAMPFSSTRIFLEETSLVARPGLAMDDIKRRMEARLRHLGIVVKRIEEDERCVIPMGGPLPLLPQRVVGIGGTAGMVHPSTGYMVARTLAAAPVIADAAVRVLGGGLLLGDEAAEAVWREVWPVERRRQREFFCFGMDILLKLDLEGTRRFFDAFFDLEPHYWHGFLSSRLYLPELVRFGLALFMHASNESRVEIMAKGTVPLAKMIGNLVKDQRS